MFFFRKKQSREKAFYEDSDRLFLYRGAFYWKPEGLDASNTITVVVGEDFDEDIFRSLAMDCAEHLLSDGAVVLNKLFYCWAMPLEGGLSEDPCVMEYVAQGGTPVFESKNSLYTLSRGIDRRLVDCICQNGYGFVFHKYSAVENAPFKLDLTIGYYEDHQHLLVVAPSGISEYADAVVAFCKARGWDIVVPTDNM